MRPARIFLLFNCQTPVKQGTITQRFVPMLLPAHYATQLELAPGTPIIMVESLIRSRSGVPVIYV